MLRCFSLEEAVNGGELFEKDVNETVCIFTQNVNWRLELGEKL